MKIGKFDKGTWVIYLAGEFYATFEFSTPLWWLPKIKVESIKGQKWLIRVGWLMVAIGIMKRFSKEEAGK